MHPAMTTRRTFASAILTTLLLLACPLRSDASDQPHPYRFGPGYHQPQIESASGWQLYVEQSLTNHWMYRPREYIIDAEVYRALVQLRRGLGGNIELGLGLPASYLSGGILDGFIEDFHRTFGLGDASRSSAPNQGLVAQVYDWDSETYRSFLDGDDYGWRLERPELQITWSPSLYLLETAVHCFWRLPLETGRNTTVEPKPAYGFSVTVGKRLGAWYISAGPGVSRLRDDYFLGIPLRDWVFGVAGALEYSPRFGRHRFWLQGLMQKGIAETYPVLSENRYQFLLGYALRWSETTEFEINLLENAIRFDNTPDFGLILGITRGI